MARPYISRGFKTTGQKTKHPGQENKRTQKQWKNMHFLQNEAGAAGQENEQILRLLENLEIIGKRMVSSLQSWQRVTATQDGPKRTARNHARNPLKTSEFLMFSDGPQPKMMYAWKCILRLVQNLTVN